METNLGALKLMETYIERQLEMRRFKKRLLYQPDARNFCNGEIKAYQDVLDKIERSERGE